MGIIKLANIAEPELSGTIGRPKGGSRGPNVQENNWYFSRRQDATMTRSPSAPSFRPNAAYEWAPPTWMHEDAHEVSKIDKPGGCILNMKDQIEIQMMKNKT